MKQDKVYSCSDCHNDVRERAVTEMLVDMKLCPQCYTKRYECHADRKVRNALSRGVI